MLALLFLPACLFKNSKLPRAWQEQVTSGQAVLIDVREEDEVKSGMVTEAAWFPLSAIKKDTAWKTDLEVLSKGRDIYIYCKSGRRAEEAKKIIMKEGLSAYNVGGYEDIKKHFSLTVDE